MTDKDIQIQNRLDQIQSSPGSVMQTFMQVAYAFDGLEELPGNRGYWHDKFARQVHSGLGIPYCMAFVDFVAQMTAQFLGVKDPFPIDTASSQSFFEWGKKNDLVTMSPDFGHIAVWRDGKSWQGHVGILTTDFGDNKFHSIEANTSNPLSQWRDGRYVMVKEHSFKRIGQIAEGRWLRGFINTQKAFEKL
jgi:hypothetical protein